MTLRYLQHEKQRCVKTYYILKSQNYGVDNEIQKYTKIHLHEKKTLSLWEIQEPLTSPRQDIKSYANIYLCIVYNLYTYHH